MKKIYILLVAIMVTTLSFGQTPIITMIADGACSGGVPKVLEIYADGTVDFTQYSLENQTNANTDWGNTFDLSSLGTVTDAFVYVYYDTSDPQVFATEFSAATNTLDTGTASVMSVNGDDRVRIIKTSDSTVIDQYGAEGIDGTGEAWEYADGFAKRISGTAANGGTFNPANWVFSNGGLNGLGTCNGGATFESVIGIGSYTTTATTDLIITYPAAGEVLASDSVTVSFTVTDFTVGTDGSIKYELDSDGEIALTDTNDFDLTGLSAGSHSLRMWLVDTSDAALVPAVEATVAFSVQAFTQVATIADLRTSTIDGFYELTGEAFINMAVNYNNQKWIQDTTAGILIYDTDGSITAGVRGDGISAVKGQLVEYNGLLEFKPMADATITSPSTFTIEPQVVTIAEILTNGDDYEAELVKIQNVTLADYDDAGAGTADGTFQNGKNYPMTQGTDNLMFRTNFYDVDYTGTALPTVAKDIVGLIGQYTDFQFTARDLADFSDVATVSDNTIAGFAMYPNPVNGSVLNISTFKNLDKNVQIFNLLGKQVLSKTISGTTLNISNLNAGIYLIKVEEAGEVATSKLVIK